MNYALIARPILGSRQSSSFFPFFFRRFFLFFLFAASLTHQTALFLLSAIDKSLMTLVSSHIHRGTMGEQIDALHNILRLVDTALMIRYFYPRIQTDAKCRNRSIIIRSFRKNGTVTSTMLPSRLFSMTVIFVFNFLVNRSI